MPRRPRAILIDPLDFALPTPAPPRRQCPGTRHQTEAMRQRSRRLCPKALRSAIESFSLAAGPK